MKYSRKSFYKLSVFFVILFSLFLAFFFLANNYFQAYKNQIELTLGVYFERKVFIGEINYFPPNFIILKNISTGKEKDAASKFLFSAEKIKLVISFSAFAKLKNFFSKGLYLDKPVINLSEIGVFPKSLSSIRNYIKQTIEALCSLSKEQNMKLIVSDGLLVLPSEGNPPAQISLKTMEIDPQGAMAIIGAVDLSPGYALEPIGYNFKGNFDKDGFSIKNLELKKKDFYAKLWGGFEGDVLKLGGFSYLSNFFAETPALQESLSKKIRRIKDLLPRTRIIQVSSPRDLNILDLDCELKFSSESIEVEKLNFSVNNAPISLKGSLTFSGQVLADMGLAYFPGASSVLRWKNRGFDAQVTGALEGKKFNGKLGINFFRKEGKEILYEKTETKFTNLTFHPVNKEFFKVFFEKAGFSYAQDKDLYALDLQDFQGLINLKGKKVKFGFKASVYEGAAAGYGLLDISRAPFKNFLQAKARKINFAVFNPSLKRFLKAGGTLESGIRLYGLPGLNLKGKLVINSGYLENLEMLQRLSDFFGLPELNKLDFDKLLIEFLLNDRVAGLKQVSLGSKELNLEGDFSLYKNNSISGKIFLSLSQKMLKNSEKFKPLLDLLGKEVKFVNFDFQLSGLSDSINFKWLESKFKKRLEDALPGFIKRAVERKLEHAINSILTQK